MSIGQLGRAPFRVGLRILWGILGAAFVIVSAPNLRETLSSTSFGPALANHTSDGYMAGLLHLRDGSERLEAALASLPSNLPVAFIFPAEDEKSIFLSYLVSYFAWPREVNFIPVHAHDAEQRLRSLDRSPISALFFCELKPPPSSQPATRLGSDLVLVLRKPEAASVAP